YHINMTRDGMFRMVQLPRPSLRVADANHSAGDCPMNAKPTLARSRFLPCFIAALLSAVISAALLGVVGGLFLSDGIPFGKVVAAEPTEIAEPRPSPLSTQSGHAADPNKIDAIALSGVAYCQSRSGTGGPFRSNHLKQRS